MKAVAVWLKIPDNAAYTAMVALRRLGIGVDRVERAEIVQFEDSCSDDEARKRVECDERTFNPNKHALHVVEGGRPRSGEVWIERLGRQPGAARRYESWRLWAGQTQPAAERVVRDAVERLLCNPAIEKAHYQ